MGVFCDRLKLVSTAAQQPSTGGLTKTKADIAKKSSHSYSSRCVFPTQKNPWIEMIFMSTSHVQLSGEDLLRLHDQNILTTCFWHLCPVFTHFAISCFSTFFIWCKCVWIFRKVDWPLFRCFQSHHTNSSHFLEISVANGNLIHCNIRIPLTCFWVH